VGQEGGWAEAVFQLDDSASEKDMKGNNLKGEMESPLKDLQ